MAITKTSITLLAAGAVAPGSTKAAPGRASDAIDCRGHYGGLLTYSINNGTSAPTVALTLTLQVATDGANWRDLWTVGGDAVASSSYSNAVDLPRGAMYARAIAYGNTVAPVTVTVELHAITAL